MNGVFYGVGVGPGDPELMTLKAVSRIRSCDILAIPVSDRNLTEVIWESGSRECGYPELLQRCVAYQIVLAVLPEIAAKDKLYLPMPMIKDKQRLQEIHDKGAAKAAGLLEQGNNIAFITLGDPSVYSTCLYIHKRLDRMGFDTALVPGVPSFCAAAARMNTGLAENSDELHILPASYHIEDSLNLPGTKVLMKVGKKMPVVKELVKEKQLSLKMVENCGMADERLYHSAAEIPDDSSYYSLIMIRGMEND